MQRSKSIDLKLSLLASCIAAVLMAPITVAEPVHLDSKKVKAGEPWHIVRDTRVDKLTISAGGIIASPGKALTMLVDGKEMPIEKGTYKNVQLLSSSKFNKGPAGDTERGVDNFRAALYVDHTGIVDKHSIQEAMSGGEFDSSHAKNFSITSNSPNFNGVMINGNVDYNISNAVFNFLSDGDGSDTTDFSGYGAAVAAYNGARLTLDDVEIHTSGAARLAVFSFEGADILMRDSTFSVAGGELYEGYENSADFVTMVAPPWVLGITGSARGTNTMGNKTTFTLVRTKAESANWGVVSTDVGSAMVLTYVDSELTLDGEKPPLSPNYGSGYGTYMLGSEHFYYGTTIKSGTYAGVIRDGEGYYGSSDFAEPLAIYPREQIDTGEKKINFEGIAKPVYRLEVSKTPVFTGIKGEGRKSHIISDNFGWMSHGDGVITLTQGTVVDTSKTTFLLKDGNVDVHIEDGTQINTGNGVILQLMDNDDSLVGLQMDTGIRLHFNTELNEREGYPGIDYPVEKTTTEGRHTYHFTAIDVTLKGNLYNSTGYYGSQPGDLLDVHLGKNASLVGVISASSSIHVDEKGEQNTHISMDEYYYIGQIANKVHSNGVNEVHVTLADNASWIVTGTSYLNKLTLEEGAMLTGIDGRAVEMTVDRKITSIMPGEYQGQIAVHLVN